jgi:DNA-nicking Smr family endonuclease
VPASRLNSLADLATLRDALERETEERARREREAAREKVEAEREANLFRNAIGDVEPLKVAARVDHRRAKPEPIAHQHAADEAAALAESISDGGDLDVWLEGDEATSWTREGLSNEVVRKLKRGHWVVQSDLDLHGERVEGARDLVAHFLRDAVKRRQRCVRIVHGKGHGSVGKQPILKGKVKNWLVQKDEVLAFCQAREIDGGGGALIVLLRPS